MKPFIASALIATFLFSAIPVHAAGDHVGHGHGKASGTSAQTQNQAQLVDGEVKKVDIKAGKITLSHGPLVNLNMPAMTMVMGVKNPAWLKQIKVGDKVRFVADNVDGVLSVIQLEPAK